MNALAALPTLLADRIVYTSGGLVLVVLLILLFLMWPAPATGGPRESPAGLLWVVLVVVLILLVVGFL